MRQRKRFCDISPTCYAISIKKENCKRSLKDHLSKDRFAGTFQDDLLPNLVSAHSFALIRTGPGIDRTLQENKAVNIELAGACLSGLIIHPGEVFSFWRLVGKPTEKRGYKNGRVIVGDRIVPGVGGGLCNLGHAIHRLVLHSPLEVTECHSHSDALGPDEGPRIPFGTGTSVCYNHRDFRFRNTTDQDVQLIVCCRDGRSYAQLRSRRPFPWRYSLVEEDLHFRKEGEKYYRNSKIYRETVEKETDTTIRRELVLDNHSEVLFDYALIPPDQIRG